MKAPHDRLREWMHSTGTTQLELAEKLGVAKSFVSHLVTGRKGPSLRTAARIERLSARWKRGPIRAIEWADDAEAA